MTDPVRLNLMPRERFAELPLKDKNSYLDDVARNYAVKTGRDYVPLDKDALSRLRRYYLRRVWADLKIADLSQSPIDRALASLGETIRMSSVEQDITGALRDTLPGRRVLRTPPADDAQLMFFVPAIYDAPIKDDINLMDVAPFTLSRHSRPGVIRYELKDSLITIEGGAESGLATVFDYDIFLNMVSYLAEEVRRFRAEESRGLRPSLPARNYRPNAAHILKFCRRSDGGKAYDDLESALDRLTKTTIKVVNLSGGKRRQVDSRPLIGGYTVVSRTGSNKIDMVDITIPDWVYTSVVKSDKALPLLTLHEDYFLISSGIGRFIYRLARKAAGKSDARYSARELHKRSGSTQDFRFFQRDLKQFVSRTQTFPMPDYDLALEDGQDTQILVMRRRQDAPTSSQVPVLELDS